MGRLGEHKGLIVILGAFLTLGVIYIRVTPLLETPDEPSHFSVVKYIADEAHLPPMLPVPSDAGPVPVIQPRSPAYYAPPLYYVLGAFLIADLDTDGFARGVIPNPNWARGWAPTPGRTPENKHIYVHTAAQRPPYAGWAVAMIRLRLFSLLLGAMTVGGVYALARLTNPPNGRTNQPAQRSNQPTNWALAATALVAFNPSFLFVTSGVTNDALLIALSTWAFVLMMRAARGEGRGARGEGREATQHATRFILRFTPLPWPPCRGLPAVARQGQGAGPGGRAREDRLFHVSHFVLLGLVVGLALLAKQSALTLLPVAALAVVWGVRSWRAALKELGLCFGLVALVAGWWYLHNALAYGDPLGFQPHQITMGEWRPSPSSLLHQLGQALRGYWGTFGWGLIQVEPVVYILAAVFVMIGLLGLLRPTKDPRGEQEAKSEQRTVVILGLGVLLNFVGLILWLLRTSAPYGRLLFPTLGPLAVLLVSGWQRWLGPRQGRSFAWGIGLILGLYAAVVPWRYLQPAYTHPVVSPSVVGGATALDVEFNQAVRLLGYDIAPKVVNPGDQVTLTLYWQATQPLESDLTVFVQLAPQNPQERVAGLDDYLGSSRYPTSAWQAGEVIRQAHQLRLPDDALTLRQRPELVEGLYPELVEGPSLYWFSVGLYDGPGSERLPGTANGAPLPGGAVWLGPLRLLGRDTQQPRHSVDYRLGSAIRLVGYDLDATWAGSVIVTLYWQAIAAPEGDWTVFVHLLDADGRQVTQHDGLPRQGDYPTWAWQPGDRVPDSHGLVLPPDLPPGTYSVQVGLYQPADGTRIPVFDNAERRMPDDVLHLAEITLPAESDRDGN